MKTLHILVVTRNRLTGLIDALASVKRLSLLLGGIINIETTVQDNSDLAVPCFVINYFSQYFTLHYYKSLRLLSMSDNWNEGLMHVLKQNPSYVSVLADRRLVTANLIVAIRQLEERRQPFICFDHQDVWINARKILIRGHSYELKETDRYSLLAAIGSAQINWHYPMLFNCILTTEFMHSLLERYGSLSEGSSPDMNFLARIADLGIKSYLTYDAPCIITNARHAARSNGSSALKTGTIHDIEHTRLSGVEAYPAYMDNFVTANITGSLSRYWSKSKMRALIDATGFFRSSLLELSYPKSEVAFLAMRSSLYDYVSDFKLNPDFIQAIDQTPHLHSSSQTYPMESNADLVNTPKLKLIAKVERL